MDKSFFSRVKSLGKETFNEAFRHDIALHGAAIAFYTIFSTAPLIVIILALVNFFLGEQQTTRAFTEYLVQLTGEDIATSLIQLSEESRRHSTGIFASVVAAGILLFGATTVITQLKYTLNTIWEVADPKMNSIALYFFNRMMAIVIIFMLTLLFLASLLLEGGMTFFTELFTPYLPDLFIPVLKLASSLLSISITVLFFTLIFKILPDIHARWKDIFVGACVTTVLFLIGKYLVGFYLGSTSMEGGYKAAGSFVVFMIWIYYNVQIVLIGAEFTQVYTKRYGKGFRPSTNAELIADDEEE